MQEILRDIEVDTKEAQNDASLELSQVNEQTAEIAAMTENTLESKNEQVEMDSATVELNESPSTEETRI